MLGRLKTYPRTVIAWVLIAIAIMVLHLLLPRAFAYDATAILLTIIASIYVGFALNDGRLSIMITEISAASCFILFAALGLWLNPYFWVAGLVLHGVWDWFHHPKAISTKVPSYYPPLCVVVDWMLAAFLLIWL